MDAGILILESIGLELGKNAWSWVVAWDEAGGGGVDGWMDVRLSSAPIDRS